MFAAATPFIRSGHELEDARESLFYWETRLEELPRHAVRKRREAREMAERWRGRVGEAERRQYGAGLLGAVLMLAAERRLPVTAHHTGRRLARTASRAAVAVVVAVVALLVLAGVAAVEVLAAILRAL
jgi:hypothetical protein